MHLLPVNADTCREYRRTGGSLTNIAGYLVVETITEDGVIRASATGGARLVAAFDQPNQYGEALAAAQAHRQHGDAGRRWALVYQVDRSGLHTGHGHGWDAEPGIRVVDDNGVEVVGEVTGLVLA